jgi:hypothetical protein
VQQFGCRCSSDVAVLMLQLLTSAGFRVDLELQTSRVILYCRQMFCAEKQKANPTTIL